MNQEKLSIGSRRGTWRLLPVVLSVCAILVAAGCGGGGSGSGEAGSTVAAGGGSGSSEEPARSSAGGGAGTTTGGNPARKATPGGSGQGGSAGERPEGEGGGPQSAPTPPAESGGEAGSGSSSGRAGREGNASGAKAKFVRRASAICRRRQGEALKSVEGYVQKRLRQGGKSEAALQAEAIYAGYLPQIEAMIGELRGLEPVPGNEGQFNAMLDALESGLSLAKEREYTASSVERFGAEFRPVVKPASRYGLSACAIA